MWIRCHNWPSTQYKAEFDFPKEKGKKKKLSENRRKAPRWHMKNDDEDPDENWFYGQHSESFPRNPRQTLEVIPFSPNENGSASVLLAGGGKHSQRMED